MAFVHEGVHSAAEMMATELADAAWNTKMLELATALAWVVTFFVGRVAVRNRRLQLAEAQQQQQQQQKHDYAEYSKND
eukprot:m51a1_g3513 hypothetical protein (78) ;mRNA; r:903049-903282